MLTATQEQLDTLESCSSKLAVQLMKASMEFWGPEGAVVLIGKNRNFLSVQKRTQAFAKIHCPVLITGSTGVGKEVFARSIYLLGDRCGKPFVSINCAQYRGENLTISELFGHRKGSFTGATKSRRGLFEVADGGVLFLDEIGELSLRAQGMLLRVLSERQIRPLGSNSDVDVNVRLVAATNRDLEAMVEEGTFREDLLYRLRYLHLNVPDLQSRGRDWELLRDHFLGILNRKYDTDKRFGSSSLEALCHYEWPGNVRELQGIVNVGYCLATGKDIELDAIESQLSGRNGARRRQPDVCALSREAARRRFSKMADAGESFWEVVRKPFLDRDIDRLQVQMIVQLGLNTSGGSYKHLLPHFQVEDDEYLKFMDFLRHHRLKPSGIPVQP